MSKGKYNSNIEKIEELEQVEIPSLISSFQAGNGANINDGIEPTVIPAVSGIKQSGSYVITVCGDSMEPNISSGDLVVIDTNITQYRFGDVIATCLNGDYLVKIYEPGSQCIYLASFNQDFEPIRVYDDDTFNILGKAIKIVRDI